MQKQRPDDGVHAPEGERGGGNPRRPKPGSRQDGDVLTPGVKVPNGAPVPDSDSPGSRDRVAPDGDVRRHEADPPKPRREDEHEVPPHAERTER